jgi:hypothetical protein
VALNRCAGSKTVLPGGLHCNVPPHHGSFFIGRRHRCIGTSVGGTIHLGGLDQALSGATHDVSFKDGFPSYGHLRSSFPSDQVLFGIVHVQGAFDDLKATFLHSVIKAGCTVVCGLRRKAVDVPMRRLLQIGQRKCICFIPEFVGSELESFLFKSRKSLVGRPLTDRRHPIADLYCRQILEPVVFHADGTDGPLGCSGFSCVGLKANQRSENTPVNAVKQ